MYYITAPTNSRQMTVEMDLKFGATRSSLRFQKKFN